jgi:hypothetical protein
MLQRIRTFHLTLSELLYRVLRKSSGYPTQGSTAQNASRRPSANQTALPLESVTSRHRLPSCLSERK